MKIGLTLSTGGARGIVHLAVLKALEKNNINISIVSGSSMGAVVGGLYCLGYSVSELENFVNSLTKKDVKKILDFTIPTESLLKGEGAKEYLKHLFKNNTFSDLKIPFYPISTDLISGKQVVITDGYLWEAVYASSAIPGFFKPLKKNNMVLVDGGVTNPLPVNVIRHKVDFVIASRITPDYDALQPKGRFLPLYYALRSLSILETSLSENILEKSPVDYIFDFKGIIPFSIFAFDKGAEILKITQPFVDSQLPGLLSKLSLCENS